MSIVTVQAITPILRAILARLGEQERRIAGTSMRGKVTEVDASEAKVRIAIGKDDEGNDVVSPWVPYKQTAGAMKFHNPPTVGQTMEIRSESGDVEQGVAEAFHWSDDNPANSTASDAHKMTFGDVTIDLTDGGLKFTIGGSTFDFTASGLSMTIGGTTFNFTGAGSAQTGGTITHDGIVIDKTHVHTGVEPGGALSGPPP